MSERRTWWTTTRTTPVTRPGQLCLLRLSSAATHRSVFSDPDGVSHGDYHALAVIVNRPSEQPLEPSPVAFQQFGCLRLPSREDVEAELTEKRLRLAKLEEARFARLRVREPRRERAREQAERDDLEQELEDEARRMRVLNVLKKPDAKPRVLDALAPEKVVRRGCCRPSRSGDFATGLRSA